MSVDWNNEIHRMASEQDYLYMPGVREAEAAIKAAVAIIREHQSPQPAVPVAWVIKLRGVYQCVTADPLIKMARESDGFTSEPLYTHPIPAEGLETLQHVHITDKKAVITGDPADYEDEDPRAHNCDQMGCPTLDHVLYRLPFTDHRKPVDTKALAKQLAESIDFTAGPVQARELFESLLSHHRSAQEKA